MRLGGGPKSTTRYCILDSVILVVSIRWAMAPSPPGSYGNVTLPMATPSSANVSIALTRTVFVCISRLLAAYRNSEAGVLHSFLHVKF